MNEQKPPHAIEWTRVWGRRGYTANPVRGCKHECRWKMPDGTVAICYAEAIAEGIAKKAYPDGFSSLRFDPTELEAIRNLKEPSGIFIDSMSDLFGHDVPRDWIIQTLEAVKDSPQHIFFSLTKNAIRLRELSFPPNLWVGISSPPSFMHGKEIQKPSVWFGKALQWLCETDAKVKWVSLEPLAHDLSNILQLFKGDIAFAVIGAASDGPKTHQPDKATFAKTLEALKGIPVFFKGNLSRKLAHDVAGGWREEFPPQTEIQTCRANDLFPTV